MSEPGPRSDPDFPDRPQHDDFFELAKLVREIDASVDSERTNFGEVVEAVIDMESLEYMAKQRALRAHEIALKSLRRDGLQRILMSSMYIDGFLAGHAFAKKDEE